jgi:hypothetical protein
VSIVSLTPAHLKRLYAVCKDKHKILYRQRKENSTKRLPIPKIHLDKSQVLNLYRNVSDAAYAAAEELTLNKSEMRMDSFEDVVHNYIYNTIVKENTLSGEDETLFTHITSQYGLPTVADDSDLDVFADVYFPAILDKIQEQIDSDEDDDDEDDDSDEDDDDDDDDEDA